MNLTTIKNWVYHPIYNFQDWWVYHFQNPYMLNSPYGCCPVQIEGQLTDGNYYYFRSRGCNWSMALAKNEWETLDPNKRIVYYSEKYGTQFEAGCISKSQAIKFATKALDKYYDSKYI